MLILKRKLSQIPETSHFQSADTHLVHALSQFLTKYYASSSAEVEVKEDERRNLVMTLAKFQPIDYLKTMEGR